MLNNIAEFAYVSYLGISHSCSGFVNGWVYFSSNKSDKPWEKHNNKGQERPVSCQYLFKRKKKEVLTVD